MSKPVYIRHRNIISLLSDNGERLQAQTTSYSSINKAKRESRKLQAAGNVVRVGKM